MREKLRTLKLKEIVYPIAVATILILWHIFSYSDNAIRYQDYAFEGLIILCLSVVWVTHPSHLRSEIILNVVTIVICLRLTFYNDTEEGKDEGRKGRDFKTLMAQRLWFQNTFVHF